MEVFGLEAEKLGEFVIADSRIRETGLVMSPEVQIGEWKWSKAPGSGH